MWTPMNYTLCMTRWTGGAKFMIADNRKLLSTGSRAQIDPNMLLAQEECGCCKRMEEHTIVPIREEGLHWALKHKIHVEGNPPLAHFENYDATMRNDDAIIESCMAEVRENRKKFDAWKVENDRFKAEVASLVLSFHELKQNMAFVPGSPVRARNSAKLNAMTNGRFETLGDLEYEYEYYLLDEDIFWIQGGNLAQNLAKFVCESTNVRCAEGDRPAQEDIQSPRLVEAEVKEFLEKAFRGEE